MYVKKEICDFDDLSDNSWGGAESTLDIIVDAGKEDELMELLEEIYGEETPTETELNDYLWHESEDIFDRLGLDENGNPIDEEEEEEEDDEEIEDF